MIGISQASVRVPAWQTRGHQIFDNSAQQKGISSMAFALDNGRTRAASKFKRSGSFEYRAIFSVTFAVFLATEILCLSLPSRWSKRTDEAAISKSLIQRAKDSASTCAAYAFMG